MQHYYINGNEVVYFFIQFHIIPRRYEDVVFLRQNLHAGFAEMLRHQRFSVFGRSACFKMKSKPLFREKRFVKWEFFQQCSLERVKKLSKPLNFFLDYLNQFSDRQ